MITPAGDAAFARWLARAAGEALLALRAELGFDDALMLKNAGDKISHELLTGALERWRPGDAVLSEEGADSSARLGADRVWIIDPLDGTREFSEEGRTDWAVHVALWRRALARPGPGDLVAGAVGMPARGIILGTDTPPAYPPLRSSPGAPVLGARTAPAAVAHETLRIACSRSRPPAFLTALADELGAELVPMGSAGVKVSAVVTGEVDAYVHAGGQYEWDSAAPVAVARATGLHTSRIDGSVLDYNQPDPTLPDLLVCRKDLAHRLLATISSL
ncbi:3'(2'),5'-bisphosphate nucleotidase CysQ [Longispora sp. K20-0274]